MGAVGMIAAASSYALAPRFVYYSYSRLRSIVGTVYRIEVVELNPGVQLPHGSVAHVAFTSIRSEYVKQVLKQTKFATVEDSISDFERVERVVKALNNMDMALQAAELEPNGIQKLFNQLWSTDV